MAGLVADGRVQPTISDFFHTTQRDLLVGGLVAIGLFLAVHRGLRRYPGRWISPDLIAMVAGLAAIGVAFFPNESETISTFTQRALGLELSPAFHYVSAVLLYLMMSLTCFLIYAPDATGWERKFYLVMGAIVWTTGWNVMILSGIKNNGSGWLAEVIQAHNVVYWDESLGVWAFSASWLLKAVLEQKRAEALGHLRKVRLGAFFGLRLYPGGRGPRPGSGRIARLRTEVVSVLRRLGNAGSGLPDKAEAPVQGPVVPAPLSRHRRVDDRRMSPAAKGRTAPKRRAS
ncbi:MAG: hypothetical protein CMH11_04305 [Maritimibacter sp.]|nr:hypothetical protein [Maritimibacter sp.]